MWQLRYVVNSAKALAPFQNELRKLKRSLKPFVPDSTYENAISGGFNHIESLRGAGLAIEGEDFLEIGSGWFPIIPMLFRMAGAKRVYLTDTHVLLDRRNLSAAAAFLHARTESVAERLGVGPDRVQEVTCGLDGLEFDQQMRKLGFTYLAPFDIAHGGLPRVDGVFSQTVLEHIPPATIDAIVAVLKRSLPAGAVMSHGIDNTDHRSHRDGRLGRFDFLKYSDTVWRILCINPQDYTNRLRHSEYVDLFGRHGYDVKVERRYCKREEAETVQRLPPWGRFGAMAPDDLATAWTHLVCRLPRSAL